MICNCDVTIYHKIFNEETRIEEWVKTLYKDVWFFGEKGARLDNGFENANDVKVRIPYFKELDINNFSIGDIIVQGVSPDITAQQDLEGFNVFNITMIKDNNFGSSPHIHLGAK